MGHFIVSFYSVGKKKPENKKKTRNRNNRMGTPGTSLKELPLAKVGTIQATEIELNYNIR